MKPYALAGLMLVAAAAIAASPCLIAVSYSGLSFTATTTPLGPYPMPSLSMTLQKPDCSF